jgi:hypothetical protein
MDAKRTFPDKRLMPHCGFIGEILTEKTPLTRRSWTSLLTPLKTESGLERRQLQTHGADLMRYLCAFICWL